MCASWPLESIKASWTGDWAEHLSRSADRGSFLQTHGDSARTATVMEPWSSRKTVKTQVGFFSSHERGLGRKKIAVDE